MNGVIFSHPGEFKRELSELFSGNIPLLTSRQQEKGTPQACTVLAEQLKWSFSSQSWYEKPPQHFKPFCMPSIAFWRSGSSRYCMITLCVASLTLSRVWGRKMNDQRYFFLLEFRYNYLILILQTPSFLTPITMIMIPLSVPCPKSTLFSVTDPIQYS